MKFGISRRSRAVTAKKFTKKRDARAKVLFCKSNLSATRTFRACLQGEKGYRCARVTLASGLKLALVYKQISQAGSTLRI